MMEFATEEEAREMIGDAEIFDTGSGMACNISTQNKDFSSSYKRNRYVGAYVSGGILYLAKKGVTYNKSLAKAFTEDEATTKVSFMKKGAYQWKVL